MPDLDLIAEITPKELRCNDTFSCPSVYRLSDGRVLIVGQKPPASLLAQITDRIGPHEHAVIIDPTYLRDV